MFTLSKSLTVLVGLLVSILPAFGADENAVRAVADTENKFAQTCLERGIRESFLQFFADDCIVFAPEPANGKKVYTKYEEKGRKLIWQPAFATIANSGDFGLTTGPWEMQKSATDNTPLGYGEFTSIWKKQADNSWKVIVDVGYEHAQPGETPGQIQLLPPNEALRNVDVDLARGGLEKAEQSLAQTMKEGAGSAIMASASNEIRVLRDASFPAVGKAAAKLMLSSDNGKMTREKMGGGLSVSGDLAYRYGSYSSERPNVTERGYYFTVWKAEPNQDWKILLDLQKKAPDKKS